MDKKEISWRQNMTDGKREIIRQRLSEYEIQTTQDIQVLKICLVSIPATAISDGSAQDRAEI